MCEEENEKSPPRQAGVIHEPGRGLIPRWILALLPEAPRRARESPHSRVPANARLRFPKSRESGQPDFPAKRPGAISWPPPCPARLGLKSIWRALPALEWLLRFCRAHPQLFDNVPLLLECRHWRPMLPPSRIVQPPPMGRDRLQCHERPQRLWLLLRIYVRHIKRLPPKTLRFQKF